MYIYNMTLYITAFVQLQYGTVPDDLCTYNMAI